MELFIILGLTIIDLLLFLIIVVDVENEELATKFLICASVLHPAIKEQRDILMKVMNDSGYEWDTEKKELKKKKK